MQAHELLSQKPIVVASSSDEPLRLWCTLGAAAFVFSGEGAPPHPLDGVGFRSAALLRLLQARDLTIDRRLEIRLIENGTQFAILHEQALALVGVCLPPKRLDAGRFYTGDLPDVSRIVLEDEIRPNLVFLSAHYVSKRDQARNRRIRTR
jgi:hypothetical protein